MELSDYLNALEQSITRQYSAAELAARKELQEHANSFRGLSGEELASAQADDLRSIDLYTLGTPDNNYCFFVRMDSQEVDALLRESLPGAEDQHIRGAWCITSTEARDILFYVENKFRYSDDLFAAEPITTPDGVTRRYDSLVMLHSHCIPKKWLWTLGMAKGLLAMGTVLKENGIACYFPSRIGDRTPDFFGLYEPENNPTQNTTS